MKENEQRLLYYVAKQKAEKKSDLENKMLNQNNEDKENEVKEYDKDSTKLLMTTRIPMRS